MPSHQATPSQTSTFDIEETSSQSSHSSSISSHPTSPSHSPTASPTSTDFNKLTLYTPSLSSAETDQDEDQNQDLFTNPPPIEATLAEIQEFSILAAELALFASCIAPPPSPPTPSPSPSSPSHSTPTPQPEPTPEELTAQAADARAVLEQRKTDLRRDLVELIGDEDGESGELINDIDRLLRDWRGVHERLDRWRRELKGERVRAMYARDLE